MVRLNYSPISYESGGKPYQCEQYQSLALPRYENMKLKKGRPLTHGATIEGNKSPEYHSWASAKARCNNPKSAFYHRYGGRGISMCERWNNSFASFLADMGKRPHKTNLDRKNNNGNYDPDNCRWATFRQQALNRPPAGAMLNHKLTELEIQNIKTKINNGETQKNVAKQFNISPASVRYHLGMVKR